MKNHKHHKPEKPRKFTLPYDCMGLAGLKGDLRHLVEQGERTAHIKWRAHRTVKTIASRWCSRRTDPALLVDELQGATEILSIRKSPARCYPLADIVLAVLVHQIEETRPSYEVDEARAALHELYLREGEISRAEFALVLAAMSMYETDAVEAQRLVSRALALTFATHPALWNFLLRLMRDISQKSGDIEAAHGITAVLADPEPDAATEYAYVLNPRLFGLKETL